MKDSVVHEMAFQLLFPGLISCGDIVEGDAHENFYFLLECFEGHYSLTWREDLWDYTGAYLDPDYTYAKDKMREIGEERINQYAFECCQELQNRDLISLQKIRTHLGHPSNEYALLEFYSLLGGGRIALLETHE